MAAPAGDATPDPDFVRRVVSSLVLAPLVVVAAWYGGIPLALLVGAGGMIAALEWDRLVRSGRRDRLTAVLLAVVLGVVVSTHLGRADIAVAIVTGGAAAIGLIALAQRRPPVLSAIGVIYVGLPCIALLWLRGDTENGAGLLLWLLVVVWAADIGAYFAGRTIGGPKLMRRVSPNKTWAGLLGGIVAAAAVGVSIGRLLFPAEPMWNLAALAAPLALAAQAGDLVESALKRLRGVKDAGTLIPGHGGILDRVDGLVVAAPLLAAVTLLSWGI